jgi:murein DD-endopeptidase MepM/ murein hydrolase activator NlpD
MRRQGRGGRGVPSALALALALAVGVLPSPALAEDDADTRQEVRAAERDAREAEREAKREAEEAEREAEEAEREARREALREARAGLDAARADLRAAQAALAAAREATRSARSAGGAAEAGRRAAEDAVAPSIVEHLEAREAAREARLRVRALREDLRDLEDEIEVARRQFDERVVRAYKQGSVAAQTTLPLSLFREVSSPGELTSALKDLEVVAGFGATRLEELAEEVVHLQTQMISAIAERDDAKEALARTAEVVDAREDEAAAQRAGAAATEANLLAAVRRELEAERAAERAKPPVAEARAAYERVRAEGGEADDTEPAAEADPADAGDDAAAGGTPPTWIDDRERALSRQRSVPAEARRAAADWACPVEGSRFVNDWGFPRSQERRHEGTDVFADEGTPIVAAVDAEVVAVNHVDRFNGRSGFGGLTVSYEADGQRFYNAHLQRIRPGLEVGDGLEAGEVLGWVGRTGNARTTPPHLHLGVYVDDVAVNPYPSLAVACAADGRQTGDDEDAERVAELDQRRAAREERRAERDAQEERDERRRRGTSARDEDGDDEPDAPPARRGDTVR